MHMFEHNVIIHWLYVTSQTDWMNKTLFDFCATALSLPLNLKIAPQINSDNAKKQTNFKSKLIN